MNTNRFYDSLNKDGGMVDFQDPNSRPRNGQMHLMIIAIDSENPMETKSAMFHFSKRKAALVAFSALVTVAKKVHMTTVEDEAPDPTL